MTSLTDQADSFKVFQCSVVASGLAASQAGMHAV